MRSHEPADALRLVSVALARQCSGESRTQLHGQFLVDERMRDLDMDAYPPVLKLCSIDGLHTLHHGQYLASPPAAGGGAASRMAEAQRQLSTCSAKSGTHMQGTPRHKASASTPVSAG